MLFLCEYHFWALLFWWLGLPALGLVPFFFGWQLVRRSTRSGLLGGRWVFWCGALALLPLQLWVVLNYQKVTNQVNALRATGRLSVTNLAAVLPRDYVTERIVGMHFRYHTSPLIELDGWRPPLHDPLVNMALWVMHDPLDMPLAARVALYEQLFPEQSVWIDCYCAPLNGHARTYPAFDAPKKGIAFADGSKLGYWPVDSIFFTIMCIRLEGKKRTGLEIRVRN